MPDSPPKTPPPASGASKTGTPDIPSPCVSICTLDPVSGACLGCLRTAGEIGEWPAASNERRLAILDDLKERRRARGQTSAADQKPRRRSRSNRSAQR